MQNLKTEFTKNISKNDGCIEAIITSLIGMLMIIQRFLPGAYKPVMDDWFVYGDVYKGLSSKINDFFIPNAKFAIRPAAGLFDCFVTAPLFNHLWIAELIVTLSLLAGVFLIVRALRKNGLAGAGLLMCLVCLFPVGLEATYWIAAANRISYSVLFIGVAVYALDFCLKTGKTRGMVIYAVSGLLCVGFYEPAIVIYILLTLFVIFANKKETRSGIALLIMLCQIAFIGIYYIINSSSGEMELRGGLATTDFFKHFEIVRHLTNDIFKKYSKAIVVSGFKDGMLTILGGHKILNTGIISLLCVLLGIFSAMYVQKRRFSVRIFIFGAVMFFGGLSLNFVLESVRIPLRLVYFSYFGAGIMLDEALMLLPHAVSKILCGVLSALLAFVFTTAGIGEVREYRATSDTDVSIISQIIELDAEHNVTNADKNTYLFGAEQYYDETGCIQYLEHIRSGIGYYADITGCMRHLTGKSDTNNIMPFKENDVQGIIPYINMDDVCGFYNLEADRTVTKVHVVPDGENYVIVREDGSYAGTLTKVDEENVRYTK